MKKARAQVEKSGSRRVRVRSRSTVRANQSSPEPAHSSRQRPLRFEFAFDRGQEFIDGQLLQILLVEPFELGAIENGVGAADAGERESLDQFGGARNSELSPRPAEQRQEIAKGLGQKTFVAVGAHAGGAVAFGEARAVGAQDERDMGKDREAGAASAR